MLAIDLGAGDVSSREETGDTRNPHIRINRKTAEPVASGRQPFDQLTSPHAATPDYSSGVDPFARCELKPAASIRSISTFTLCSMSRVRSASSMSGRALAPMSEPTKEWWSILITLTGSGNVDSVRMVANRSGKPVATSNSGQPRADNDRGKSPGGWSRAELFEMAVKSARRFKVSTSKAYSTNPGTSGRTVAVPSASTSRS